VEITFDPAKDAKNIEKHGVSLNLVARLDWSMAVTEEDDRFEYGEERLISIGPIEGRLYVVVFTEREGVRRIISLRKANRREFRRYEQATT
jgi:uncharacterized DUF497 family protein